MKLTEKQKRFCDYYIQTGNATLSAIKAGYSKKTSRVIGQENLLKPALKKYIEERHKELESKRIADASEVLQYLTSVMRGEVEEEQVVVESQGDGFSSANIIKKQVGAKDRNKAAELLGKSHMLFTERVDANINAQVVFEGEDQLED